jgi:hypothetical protein
VSVLGHPRNRPLTCGNAGGRGRTAGESIQIKWRGDGSWQSETFTDPRLAAEFRTAVELAGHRWPQGWVKGEGWTLPDRDSDVGVPEPVVVTVADVAAHGLDGYFAHQRVERSQRASVRRRQLQRLRRGTAGQHSRRAGVVEAFPGRSISDPLG